MRTVSNLLSLDGRIYVKLSSENIQRLFLKNAEEEGFTFGDGGKPTERKPDSIMALHHDWTISYVGFAGHMAFYHSEISCGKPLIRVDYGKYIAGRDDYIIKKEDLS